MKTELENKVAIVTGGASGIGKATVENLLEEGAIPILIDKDRQKGERFSHFLADSETEHLFIHADLTHDENCKVAVRHVIDKYKRIDVLINNAGGNDFLDIDTTSPKEFRESLERNLVHYYTMTHYSWPYLKESRGNVIFVGSKVALVGEGKTTAYAAAKGGCIGLTRELATKSAKENLGIRVNCVLPGEVRTPLYEAYVQTHFDNPEDGYNKLAHRVPFGRRPTKPEEVAYTIVFLASNRLAGHITGQLISPDGGYVHIDRNI